MRASFQRRTAAGGNVSLSCWEHPLLTGCPCQVAALEVGSGRCDYPVAEQQAENRKRRGNSPAACVVSSDEPSPLVDVEFHQTFVAHFQKQGLASFLIRDIGAPHDFVDLERLLSERIQDILAIVQHDYFLQAKSGVHC
jgi:hypothetical protein